MSDLAIKHLLEEMAIFPAWLKADANSKKRIVAVVAKKQAKEIIQKKNIWRCTP